MAVVAGGAGVIGVQAGTVAPSSTTAASMSATATGGADTTVALVLDTRAIVLDTRAIVLVTLGTAHGRQGTAHGRQDTAHGRQPILRALVRPIRIGLRRPPFRRMDGQAIARTFQGPGPARARRPLCRQRVHGRRQDQARGRAPTKCAAIKALRSRLPAPPRPLVLTLSRDRREAASRACAETRVWGRQRVGGTCPVASEVDANFQ
jgi:hypothetical protein